MRRIEVARSGKDARETDGLKRHLFVRSRLEARQRVKNILWLSAEIWDRSQTSDSDGKRCPWGDRIGAQVRRGRVGWGDARPQWVTPGIKKPGDVPGSKVPVRYRGDNSNWRLDIDAQRKFKGACAVYFLAAREEAC